MTPPTKTRPPCLCDIYVGAIVVRVVDVLVVAVYVVYVIVV
jgi:hypothetical protein